MLVGMPVEGPPCCTSMTTSGSSAMMAQPSASVFKAMRENGIGVNVHYIPVHLQPYYRRMGFKPGDFPIAETYYAGAISIPLYSAMTDEQQDRVAEWLAAQLERDKTT